MQHSDGRPRPVDWNWNEALRGALCALPGAIIVLTVEVGLGMFCAMGVLPFAMLGVPPTRKAALRFVLLGLQFAVAYALGSVVGTHAVLAVVVLTTVAYVAVLAIDRKPAMRVLSALIVPAFALGMNEPPSTGVALAGMFAAGSVWAVLVGVCFRSRIRPRPAPAVSGATPIAVRVFAVAYAAAAGIGLTLGFVLDVEHPAWIAAAAMFILQPIPSSSRARAVQRLLATVLGVTAAGLISLADPADWVLALVTLCTIAALIATRASRWYVTPFGSGLIVLLISGASSSSAFDVAFRDRILETAIGAGLAAIAVWLAPIVIERRSPVTAVSG